MLDSRGSISGRTHHEKQSNIAGLVNKMLRLIMSSPPHPVMHFGMTGIFYHPLLKSHAEISRVVELPG